MIYLPLLNISTMSTDLQSNEARLLQFVSMVDLVVSKASRSKFQNSVRTSSN